MIKHLLDTNIFLGLIKGRTETIDLLRGVKLIECAYSSVTRMELLGFPGITENEIKIISALLKQMPLLQINSTIENKTILLKQQHKMKLPDAIILATALVNELELLTLDKNMASKFVLLGR